MSMEEQLKIIKDHQKLCRNKLADNKRISGNVPVLLLASYCEDKECTDKYPCEECLKMCNIAFIDRNAIKPDKIICGYNFLND